MLQLFVYTHIFRKELETIRRFLGEDYLERIEERVKDFRSEIIIAVENIKGGAQEIN